MNIAKETVTPKKAMQWMKCNVTNRPLSKATIKQYATAMQQGAWKLNGDSICFNCNGDLIDGQHRLAACIKVGCSFESYVIHGLDHQAFDTIDQGKRRTIADVFARDGYKHYKILASATRWTWLYQSGMTIVIGRDIVMKEHSALRLDEAHELIEANPSLHHAADLACVLHRQQKLMKPGILAFLIHETGRSGQDRADNFWTRVIVGENLTKGQASHLLHKRLVEDSQSNTVKLPPVVLIAMAIKAWNAEMSGKHMGVLKWLEEEDFPLIK
jgi:hypothetical protein